jgi:hypothetical protein
MPATPSARRRSAAVSISAVTALASVFLAGCGDDDGSDRYCADRTTNTRVDDRNCDSGHVGPRYGWYWLAAGASRPRIGGKATGGSYTAPSRGGFGGHGTSGGG